MSGFALRRSERLAAVVKLLCAQPGRIVPLSELGERFGAAKSTMSEDVQILRELFAAQGFGRIETLAGASGGVRYYPELPEAQVAAVVRGLCEELAQPSRILPGGFLYMTDLISSPPLLADVGAIFAGRFGPARADVVLTIETRGIPLAVATAHALGVPLAIARRASRPSDGTVVTMNYVSGSSRIETMSLPRRALSGGARVLVVDDFMKGGGTARGLIDLTAELEAEVIGVGVLIETADPAQKRIRDYVSLCILDAVDEESREVRVRPSTWVVDTAGHL